MYPTHHINNAGTCNVLCIDRSTWSLSTWLELFTFGSCQGLSLNALKIQYSDRKNV